MKKNYTLMGVTAFLITTFLPYLSYVQALGKQTSTQQASLLIDKSGEVTVYIGAFLIIIASATIIGVLSRRIEHAVFTALGLSLILIAFFFFISQ
jgi:hypothetical protein